MQELKLPSGVQLFNCPTKEEWLRVRESHVGASEIASLFAQEIVELGEDPPFQTELELYNRKIGILEPQEETHRMRMGARFESAIADELAENWGWRLLPPFQTKWGVMMREGRAPLSATPDRFGFSQDDDGWFVVEIKYSPGPQWERIPMRYMLQVQQQMLISGLSVAKVCHCSSNGLEAIRVPADYFLQEELARRAREFWGRVLKREPPQPTGRDLGLLKRLYPKHVEKKEVKLPGELEGALQGWVAAKAVVKEAEDEKDECETLLRAAIGDAESAVFPSGMRLTLKTQTKKAHQVKESTSRVLRLAGEVDEP